MNTISGMNHGRSGGGCAVDTATRFTGRDHGVASHKGTTRARTLAITALHQKCGACQLAKKGGKTNNMKYLTIIALAAAGLALAGCAKDQPSQSTQSTHSASTSGYGK